MKHILRLSHMSLQQLNDKFNTFDSILTADRKLNSKVSRLKMFNQLDIYKKVIDDTYELNKFQGILFQHRVHFLLGNAKIEKCNICGKDFIEFHNTLSRFTLCNHKQRYTQRSKEQMIKAREKLFDDFIDSLNDTQLMCSEDEFAKTLNEMMFKKENFNFMVTKNSSFYHDLIMKTSNLIQFDKDQMRISKRIYFAYHKIFSEDDLPTCKFCGKNHTPFMNRTHGFRDNCDECAVNKSNNTRHMAYVTKIDSLLDHNKYEVVHYPDTLNSDVLSIRCKKCNHVSSLKIHNGRINDLPKMMLCSNCEKIIGSRLEQQMFEYVSSIYHEKIIHGGKDSRKVIEPYELDFFFPSINAAIEMNGTYWHSSENLDDAVNCFRHIDKFNACKRKNISLIQLFEDVWMFNEDLSKRYVRMMLGCEQNSISNLDNASVMKVDNKQAYSFHVDNDLRGGLKAKVNIGVFNEGFLISLVSCRISEKHKVLNIHRLSFVEMSKEHRQICFNKLLRFIQKEFSSYQINIIFDNLYPALVDMSKIPDFKEISIYKPTMRYCKGCQRYDHTTHSQFVQMMSTYDSQMTFDQNMIQNGFRRVYDAGKTIFTRTI